MDELLLMNSGRKHHAGGHGMATGAAVTTVRVRLAVGTFIAMVHAIVMGSRCFLDMIMVFGRDGRLDGGHRENHIHHENAHRREGRDESGRACAGIYRHGRAES
jgi:hypothetical protein